MQVWSLKLIERERKREIKAQWDVCNRQRDREGDE